MNITSKCYKFRNYLLCEKDQTLKNGNNDSCKLPIGEYETLHKLVTNQGTLLTNDDLFIDWDKRLGKKEDIANDVSKRISMLRARLFDDDKHPRFIQTIYKQGHKFIHPVETIDDNELIKNKEIITSDFDKNEPVSPQNKEEADDEDSGLTNEKLEVDETHKFKIWLNNSGRKFKSICFFLISSSILLSIVLLVIFSYYFPTNIEGNKSIYGFARLPGSIIHLIMIIWALRYYRKHYGYEDFRPLRDDIENGRVKDVVTKSTGYKKISDWTRAREIAMGVLKQYRRNWKLLMYVWFALYLTVTIASLTPLIINDPGLTLIDNYLILKPITYTFNIFITISNNFNTLFIWLCFYTLHKPITTENKNENGGRLLIKRDQEDTELLGTGVRIIGVWVLIECVAVILLPPEITQKLSSGISGVLGGLSMALYVGCFQSKFLKSPDKLIVILYIYTVIQAFFIYFNDGSIQANIALIIIINAALYLKCILILYNFWLFESGRLLFYLVRVRRATEQVDFEWQYFLKMLKKNKDTNYSEVNM